MASRHEASSHAVHAIHRENAPAPYRTTMAQEPHIFGKERIVAGQQVVIAEPKKTPQGLTFLLTAANISLSKYLSIRDALLGADQIVVGFFINALNPLLNNHRVKAEKVRCIWDELKRDYKFKRYSVVGHSIGGKIALLVAALHDDDGAVKSIVALDPVDQTPTEFTNKKASRNLSLTGTTASIAITFTDGGFFVSKEHNGRAINRINPDCTTIRNHRNAGHMCYCDDEKGLSNLSWKAAMASGNDERNSFANRDALQLITEKTQVVTAKKLFKNAKKAVQAEIKGATDEVKGITGGPRGLAAKTAAKGFLKSAGL